MYTSHGFCINQLLQKAVPHVCTQCAAFALISCHIKLRVMYVHARRTAFALISSCHRKLCVVYVHVARLLHWSVVTKRRALCMYMSHGFCIDQLSQKDMHRVCTRCTAVALVSCHRKPRVVYVHVARLLQWSVVTKSHASCLYTSPGFDQLSQKAVRVMYVLHRAASSVPKGLNVPPQWPKYWFVQLARQKAWPARSKSVETNEEGRGLPILWDLNVSKEVHMKPHVGSQWLRQRWRKIIVIRVETKKMT